MARLNREMFRSHVELSCATDAGGLAGFDAAAAATGAGAGVVEDYLVSRFRLSTTKLSLYSPALFQPFVLVPYLSKPLVSVYVSLLVKAW